MGVGSFCLPHAVHPVPFQAWRGTGHQKARLLNQPELGRYRYLFIYCATVFEDADDVSSFYQTPPSERSPL